MRQMNLKRASDIAKAIRNFEKAYANNKDKESYAFTSSVHISCCGKVHRADIRSFEDWYVFLNMIPAPDIPELLAQYEDKPIRAIPSGMEFEWNAPGAEPWVPNEGQAIANRMQEVFDCAKVPELREGDEED